MNDERVRVNERLKSYAVCVCRKTRGLNGASVCTLLLFVMFFSLICSASDLSCINKCDLHRFSSVVRSHRANNGQFHFFFFFSLRRKKESTAILILRIITTTKTIRTFFFYRRFFIVSANK